jgi:signal transduction histidine kinase
MPNAGEASQATLFVDAKGRDSVAAWRGGAAVAELLPLASRFLGPDRAREAFERHARDRGLVRVGDLPADARLAQFAEGLLAGAIGSASARVMVASLVQEEPLGLDEVMDILDEASQVRAYSRELEEKSLELEQATAELRAANAQLRELDRMKDDFISTVSHELRTPLTSIRAFSEMLLDDPDIGLDERKHFLGIIVGEAGRLSRLINQILDMAKLESGRAEWTTEAVDLRAVVTASVESLGQMFRDKGVEVGVDLLAGPVTVFADRDRLTQVMINLLSNAQKFVPDEGGCVSAVVRREGHSVLVAVNDNGPGIAPEDRELVFEKFRQGGSVLTDKPHGTGLGLPISRQIIEHFGGRLWVESAPGKGATFQFMLPIHDEGTPSQ